MGGASAISQSPSIMSMSRSSASQPLGGAWGSGGAEGAGGADADTFEGLGPLEEKEVGKLTAKLRALPKKPAVPLDGGSTKEQEEKSKEEWLRCPFTVD